MRMKSLTSAEYRLSLSHTHTHTQAHSLSLSLSPSPSLFPPLSFLVFWERSFATSYRWRIIVPSFSVCGFLQQQNDCNNNKWEKRRKLQLLQQPRFLFIFLACYRDDDDDVRGEEQKYVPMSVTELITQQAKATTATTTRTTTAATAAATPPSDANNIIIIIIINCSLAWILFGLMQNKAILAAVLLIEECVRVMRRIIICNREKERENFNSMLKYSSSENARKEIDGESHLVCIQS
jgi:hypothetical protein